MGVSYYAVVVISWGPHLLAGGIHSFLSFSIIVVFHILLVLVIWSYLMVVLRDPGSVPKNWGLEREESIEEGSSSMAVSDSMVHDNMTPTLQSSDDIQRTTPMAVRYCSQCQNGKPPRCHHCSICRRCVLKMDHHCIWVVNCVGAQNYKFFLLFVFYAFLETTMDTVVLLPNFVKFFRHEDHSLSPGKLAVTFLAFVLNLAFALSLLCFVVMHTSLLLSNTTSVEVYEKKKSIPWKYDMGRRKNFEQVFGSKKVYWLLPLYSEEDTKNIPPLHGLDFPIRSESDE